MGQSKACADPEALQRDDPHCTSNHIKYFLEYYGSLMPTTADIAVSMSIPTLPH